VLIEPARAGFGQAFAACGNNARESDNKAPRTITLAASWTQDLLNDELSVRTSIPPRDIGDTSGFPNVIKFNVVRAVLSVWC
jgi:hypothetical protein